MMISPKTSWLRPLADLWQSRSVYRLSHCYHRHMGCHFGNKLGGLLCLSAHETERTQRTSISRSHRRHRLCDTYLRRGTDRQRRNPPTAKSNYCDVNDLLCRFSIHSSIHRVEPRDNNCRTDDRRPLQQLGPAFGGRPRRHFPG